MSRVGSRHSIVAAVVVILWNVGKPPEARALVDEVTIVFKTHFDIGYTDLARNVVGRYPTTIIDNALTVCDSAKGMPSEQRFVWTLAGWPMAQILGPGRGGLPHRLADRQPGPPGALSLDADLRAAQAAGSSQPLP